jgi:hypothetical protein
MFFPFHGLPFLHWVQLEMLCFIVETNTKSRVVCDKLGEVKFMSLSDCIFEFNQVFLLVQSLTSINPKGLTLGVKAEKENIFCNLSLYGPNLAQEGIKRIIINIVGQFAALEVNVVAIKCCGFDKIHIVRSNQALNQSLYPSFFLISSFFHFFSFLVELLCLFVNDVEGVFIYLFIWDMLMKNTRVTRILCLWFHGGLIFRV